MSEKLVLRNIFLAGVLLLSLTILQPVQAQYTADGQAFTLVSPISISSPTNATYATNQVYLHFTILSYVNARINNMTMLYSLDGNDNITIRTLNVIDTGDSNTADGKTVINVVSGSVNLERLQQGSHNLTVFGIYATHQSSKIGFDKQTVYFTIDNSDFFVESGSIVESDFFVESGSIVESDSYGLLVTLCIVIVLMAVVVVACVLFTRRRSQMKL